MKSSITKHKRDTVRQSKKFRIDCYPYIFSDEELEILREKGNDLRALTSGTRKPKNSLERRFVKVIKGKETPFSVMEYAWIKYLERVQVEKKMKAIDEDYHEFLEANP